MLIIDQIGNKTGMSYGSVQIILNEYLSLQRVRVHMCAKVCSCACMYTPLNDQCKKQISCIGNHYWECILDLGIQLCDEMSVL